MVISIMNNKGGVGKTASASTLAQVLALGGYSVLVVDRDQQANCSRIFGILEDIEGLDHNALHTKALEKEEVCEFIYQTNFKNIHIIAASEELVSMPITLYEAQKTDPAAVLAFKKNIDAIKDLYDFIIIDTAPGYDNYFIESIVAASEKILVPCEANNTSFEGVSRTIPLVKDVNAKYALNVEISGIFLTRVKNRSSLYQGMYDSYRDTFGDYFMPVGIRDTVKVQESHTTFQPLYFWDKKCTAFLDYVELAGVLGIMDNKHWKEVKRALQANQDMHNKEEEE